MKIHHVAIQVRDLERAVEFYREIFELPVVREWPGSDGRLRSVWLGLSGEAFLAIERCDGPSSDDSRSPWRRSEPGYHVLALRIPVLERDSWERRLSEHGVAVDHRSQWTIYVRDPEGNRIGLSHHPD